MVRKENIKSATRRIVPPFIIIGIIPIIISLITKGYVSNEAWAELLILGVATVIFIGIFAWLISRRDERENK